MGEVGPGPRIHALLDQIGLRYTAEEGDGGPRALFRFALEGGAEPVSFVARLREPTVRVSADRVIAAPSSNETLQRLNDLNLSWSLGGVWHDPWSGYIGLATTAYVGLETHAGHAVRKAITAARDAAQWLRTEWPRGGDAEGFMEAQLRRVPAPEVEGVVDSLRWALDQSGVEVEASSEGRPLVVEIGSGTRVEVAWERERLVVVRATPDVTCAVEAETRTLSALQELNRSAFAGAVALTGDSGRVHWQLGMPLMWTGIDVPLAQWTVHVANREANRIARALWTPG
ncbi:MAG TPA: hypothetical protein VIA06_20265 [Candidatus Dormibacteraeota bacterium]|nr:hypothetical protein [Candidatus Dormibacteraeota bacterium]